METLTAPMTFNEAAFEQFPVLRTRRLTIREIRTTDVEALHRTQASALVLRYIGRPPHEQLEQTAKQIATIHEAYENRSMLCWAAILRDGNEIIGTCGYNRFEKENLRAEFGGSLDPTYWGKGLAQEAVEAILDYGFKGLNLHAIEAKIVPQNRGAKFILEKLGFQREGYFQDRFLEKGRFLDMAHYTLFNPSHQ